MEKASAVSCMKACTHGMLGLSHMGPTPIFAHAGPRSTEFRLPILIKADPATHQSHSRTRPRIRLVARCQPIRAHHSGQVATPRARASVGTQSGSGAFHRPAGMQKGGRQTVQCGASRKDKDIVRRVEDKGDGQGGEGEGEEVEEEEEEEEGEGEEEEWGESDWDMPDPPQYTSYIDPISGETSPVFGDRAQISTRMVAAAMGGTGYGFSQEGRAIPRARGQGEPGSGQGGAGSGRGALEEGGSGEEKEEEEEEQKVNREFRFQVEEEEEENIYEEEEDEDEEDEAEQSGIKAESRTLESMNKRGTQAANGTFSTKGEPQIPQLTSALLGATNPTPDLNPNPNPNPNPKQVTPIRKSKWTAHSKEDGLIPGIRASNEVIKAIWAESGPRGDPFVKEEDGREPPKSNEELWLHHRKPKVEEQPLSDWQKHPPTAEAALLAAAAEMGQIKLYGKEPTATESVLARARKKVLKQERLDVEEKLRDRLGTLGYYRQFVSSWAGDSSLEAVAEREAEGVPLHEQVMEMLQQQSTQEYRVMMGTDMRVQRDPLAYRMTEEQVKKVWGGDAVIPVVHYEQDPHANIDYRGPTFHEPAEEPFEAVIRMGRSITTKEIQAILAREKEQELMEVTFTEDDAEAVDISEQLEDEDEEDVALLDELEDEEDELEDEEDDVDMTSAGPAARIVGPLGGAEGEPNIRTVPKGSQEEEGVAPSSDWYNEFQDYIKQNPSPGNARTPRTEGKAEEGDEDEEYEEEVEEVQEEGEGDSQGPQGWNANGGPSGRGRRVF